MQESEIKIPEVFLCPISHEIMSNPVLAEDGETYEKEEIEKYFAKKAAAAQNPQSDLKGAIPSEPVKITSPLHGTDMGTRLTPNRGIFRQIREFLDANPSLSKEAYFELGLLTEAINVIHSANVDGLARLIENEKRLLEREIKDGKSLLEVVCQEGTPELLRVVIKAKKKLGPFELTDEQLTPLVLSCLGSMQKKGLNAFMLEANWPTDRWQEFFKAHLKESGELKIIDAFVLYGYIKLDQPLDDEKNTALHLAILNKQPWKVRRLIQLDADATLENKEGLDAKRLAKKLNDRELLRNISQWKHEKRSEVMANRIAALESENALLKDALKQVRAEVTELQQDLSSPIAEKKAAKLLIERRQREEQALVREAECLASLSVVQRVNEKAQSVSGRMRGEEIIELLNYSTRGQLNEVRECLRRNRDLVHAQGDITDSSGRKFPQITGFQRAIWDGDEDLWNEYLEFLPEIDAYDQLMALVKERPDITEKHGAPITRSFDELIAAYEVFRRTGHRDTWVKNVGGALWNMPAWFIYIFSEEGEDKAWPTKQMTRGFTRNIEHLKSWFETEYGGGKCGSSFAFYRGCAGVYGVDFSQMPRRAIGFEHDLANSAKLKTLCIQKLEVLTERLERASKKAALKNSSMMNTMSRKTRGQ